MGTLRFGLLFLTAAVGMGCNDDGTSGDPGDNDGGDTESDFVPNPEADVCNFTEPVTLGEPEEDGMVHVPANHPEIDYFGRVDCSNPEAPAFGFPGVSIRAKFEGDAVDMIMNDKGSATYPNFFNVIIDNGEPIVVKTAPGEKTYPLADDLEDGEHTVEIFKRNESNGGSGLGAFLGLRIPEGRDLLTLSPRTNRLEVIGDSISCGYGNELSVDDPTGHSFSTENSNAYSAWGAIAARDLDAEYTAVAYSGRGVIRNYDDGGGSTLPEMYLDAVPDGVTAEWNVRQFTPDVLVVNLGTNDFSVGLESEALPAFREAFESAFLEFVETLRGYYPRATIILAEGPMLQDGYPPGYSARTSVKDALEAVVAARAADGDANVYYLDLGTQSAPYGEDWHPTVLTHQGMAETLMAFIDELELM